MILNLIHLQNWQPFLGRGLNSTKVELESNSGHKNLIIYGENTHGKTAIWQAIQFGFFGKVNKRKTGWEDKKWKPWMSDSTAQEPLLNQTANEKGDYTFGVILRFNHGGDDFTLERTVGPRTGISKPRKDGDLQEEPLYIRNESEGRPVKEPQDFINDILPYDLAQFFMFDGERLDQYRLLFEDTNDVKLKGYIEAILRFPVLTDGVQDFGDIKKKEDKILRQFNLRGTEDEELKKVVKKLEDQVEESETLAKKITEEIKKLNVQTIGFPRETSLNNYVKYSNIETLDCISLDTKFSLSNISKLNQNICFQGNLDPLILLGGGEELKNKAMEILTIFKNHPHIFNLGHGVLPDTKIENIITLIEAVKKK